MAEVVQMISELQVMHRPVVYVSRGGVVEAVERCPECHGAAGVHPCGCWADTDSLYECAECSRPDPLNRGTVIWPCATRQLVDQLEEAVTGQDRRNDNADAIEKGQEG